MNYREEAKKIPAEDRPISPKEVSGLGNFFGIYGGEHIAATEFVIGATLVTLGVKASDIFLGLFVGNILATLTYALICAPIAVDTRVTLYSYLKRVMGPYMQKIYNAVWGLASIAMAASMLTVSASAVREIFGIKLQTEWYPTDVKFVLVVIVLGVIVTLVAANGFEAVAKFSSVCVPWMIIVFLAGFCVVIPQLLLAVIIAGWTTANPNIYRASLAYETIFNVSSKKLTYVVGVFMTIVGCFPIAMNIMTIVNVIVLIVPSVGAIVFAEHWIIPKIGGTRYWATYKGWKMNYAGLAAWMIALGFVAVMTVTKAMHSYFLFLPTYLLAMGSYLVLACLMGAREDYTAQAEEDRKIQEALAQIQSEEDRQTQTVHTKYPGAQKAAAFASYAVLAVFAVFTVMVLFGSVAPDTWKRVSFILSITYFVLGGAATYIKFALTEKA